MNTTGKRTILLVEDEAILALAEAKTIGNFGYSVCIAHTGEKAVDIISKDPSIDLVLMDIDLGSGIDGPTAAQRILAIKTVPIVFLTSHAEREMVEKVQGITRYGYVIKNSGDFVLRSSIEMAFELFGAHEKTQEREFRLSRAEELSGFGSWEFDLAKKTVLASVGAQKIYGLGNREWTIEEVQKIPQPEYRSRLDAALVSLVKQGLPYDVEFKICRPSDQKILTIHSTAVYDPHRNLVLGTIQDVTEQREVENSLLRNQALLNEMGRIGKIGGWRYDVIANTLQWTNEVYQIHEIDSPITPSLDIAYSCFPPQSQPLIRAAIEHLMETGEGFDLVLEFVTQKGNKRWIRTAGKPVYSKGKIVARSGILQDVTERKNVEEALRRNTAIQTILREIAEAAAGASTMDELYATVYRLVGRVLPAKLFHINLLDEKAGEIVVPFRADDVNFIPDRRPIAKGLTEYTMRLGRAVYIPPAELERLRRIGEYTLANLQNVQVRHYLGAPLVDSKGKPFGVISLILMGENQTILPEDVEVFSIIAAQVSMAIERKRVEEEIKALLADKELLLREVHHRIKNNMNLVGSMLSLQANLLKDSAAVAALKDAKSRLISMGLLYDKLYRTDNLREMSLQEYLPALAKDIIRMFPNNQSIKIEENIESFTLSIKELSTLGIIANEILTNAMKYAFVGKAEGRIRLLASRQNNRVRLVIEDDGAGLPEAVDFENSSGFGLMLVGVLAKQLGGTVMFERGNGTKFILEFPA